MQLKTLEELQAKLDVVISEIDTDELDDDLVRQSIEHHVLSLSLGVHSYREMILRKTLSKEEEIKFKKNLYIYTQIEDTLAGRVNEYTTEELFKQLLTCKTILDANVQN